MASRRTRPRTRRSRRSTPPRSGPRSTRSSPMFWTSTAAREHAIFGPEAETLARAFWPGPLTLVLPVASTSRISLLARAGLDTVAIRSPSHETARALIEAAGVPLAAPSANRSGAVSPTTAAHVVSRTRWQGRLDPRWRAMPPWSRVRRSSPVSRGRPQLLRPGAITREAIESALGSPIDSTSAAGTAPNAPGQLASHYAPKTALRLGAASASADEAALDFGGSLKGGAASARLDLSPSGDLVEAASHLFSYLRALTPLARRGSRSRRSPSMGLGRRSTIGSAARLRPGEAKRRPMRSNSRAAIRRGPCGNS